MAGRQRSNTTTCIVVYVWTHAQGPITTHFGRSDVIARWSWFASVMLDNDFWNEEWEAKFVLYSVTHS